MKVPYLNLKVTKKRDLDSLSQIFKKILQNGKIINDLKNNEFSEAKFVSIYPKRKLFFLNKF